MLLAVADDLSVLFFFFACGLRVLRSWQWRLRRRLALHNRWPLFLDRLCGILRGAALFLLLVDEGDDVEPLLRQRFQRVDVAKICLPVLWDEDHLVELPKSRRHSTLGHGPHWTGGTALLTGLLRLLLVELRQPIWVAPLQADDEFQVVAFLDVSLGDARRAVLRNCARCRARVHWQPRKGSFSVLDLADRRAPVVL